MLVTVGREVQCRIVMGAHGEAALLQPHHGVTPVIWDKALNC